MSNSEQKFKVGDKVVWKDKQYAKDWSRNTIDSIMTVIVVDDNGETVLLTLDNKVEAFDFRFELYEEKEMKENNVCAFDLHKNPWYIRVENEEQFNLANEWLKENFGSCLVVNYSKHKEYLTNFDGRNVCKTVMHGCCHFMTEHELKLNFKTIISSVEYPVVEIETEQQKRIRELKETIDSASKQLEKLMKETK